MGQTCTTCSTAAQVKINMEKFPVQFNGEINKYVQQLRHKYSEQFKQCQICYPTPNTIYIGNHNQSNKCGYCQYYINPTVNNKCIAFIGIFQNNKLNGQGIIIFQNINYIKSTFINNIPQGQSLQKVNRNYFHGLYLNGNKIKGILTADQYRYQGSFKQNQFHSYGLLEYQNGDKYQGDFTNVVYHGDGTYSSRQNGVYHGEWKYGVYQGRGRYNWLNGCYYEGQYKNGLRNGIGKMIRGQQGLEGIWENGQLKDYQSKIQAKIRQSQNTLLKQDKANHSHRTTQTSTNQDLAGYTIQLF